MSPVPAAPPAGSRNPKHRTLCSARSPGCRHREKPCSQGSHCTKTLPAPTGDSPAVLSESREPEQAACRGPAQDPVSHLLADVSAPQKPDWTGRGPPRKPSRRPAPPSPTPGWRHGRYSVSDALPGALPARSGGVPSLLLPPSPHGPRGSGHKHSDAQGQGGRTDTPESPD